MLEAYSIVREHTLPYKKRIVSCENHTVSKNKRIVSNKDYKNRMKSVRKVLKLLGNFNSRYSDNKYSVKKYNKSKNAFEKYKNDKLIWPQNTYARFTETYFNFDMHNMTDQSAWISIQAIKYLNCANLKIILLFLDLIMFQKNSLLD